MTTEIAVLGAGPAGLLAACRLAEAGFAVTVFEEHRSVGYPEHCTGIVRSDFFRTVGYSELESAGLDLAGYSHGYVKAMSGADCRRIDSGATKAIMIDRPGYEAKLEEIAHSTGVSFAFGSKAALVKKDGRYMVRVGGILRGADLIVGARGVSGNPRLKTLPGLQARMVLKRPADSGGVYVAFSKELPGYFGWVAPYSGGAEAKVGLASSGTGLRRGLDVVLNAFNMKGEVKGYFGGRVVTGGCPTKIRDLNYVAVGDEAGQVKPMTGGGLGVGAVAANMLARSYSTGDTTLKEYTEWHRERRRSLKLSEAAFRLLLRTPATIRDWALEKASHNPGTVRALREADFDDHTGALRLLALNWVEALLGA
ncbi:MAG: NAD(P)/FAD-dependent oxidoreductase [Thermoprotei archaeon]